MRSYEVALILHPDLDEEQQQAIIERLSQVLTADGGQVENVESWGLRRLSYPIKKVQKGIYYFIQGQFPVSALPELDRTARLSEEVLRHMVVRMDK